MKMISGIILTNTTSKLLEAELENVLAFLFPSETNNFELSAQTS